MGKRFKVWCVVCLLVLFSGTIALAAVKSEGGTKVLPKEELTKVCMDKMMLMMTDEQRLTTVDTLMTDALYKDQMTALGTKEQWKAMPTEQLMQNIDNMILNLNKEQVAKVTDKLMLIMSKNQMTTLMIIMPRDDMMTMCTDNNMLILDKMPMDKMMSMMTNDQRTTMLDLLINDKMFRDQMVVQGTQAQWNALTKDQTTVALDKVMLSLTKDQIVAMKNKMMTVMTKDQMVIMDKHKVDKQQQHEPKISTADPLSTNKMMLMMMTDDQRVALVDSMMADPVLKDQTVALGNKEQWKAMSKEQCIMTIDQMMMSMPKTQLDNVTAKIIKTMSKEQMATMLIIRPNVNQ